MMNKIGIAALLFVMIAAGLGFAAYFVNMWITNGNDHINIERTCTSASGITACVELEETNRLVINRYLQLWAGPGLAFIAGLQHIFKLCCGKNRCSYLAAIKAFLSCGAYVASTVLFCKEHYWEQSERDTYSVSYGLVLTVVSALFSLIAAILMIMSAVQTRNQFGGKVMDAMVLKSQTKATGVTPRNQRAGRRV